MKTGSYSLPPAIPPPEGGPPDLLFIVGEHSGDEHASIAVEELKRRNPQLKIAAFGGPALQRAGAQLLYDTTGSSVVGLWEVMKHFMFYKDLYYRIVDWVETYPPKAICFVDYPGINLRLADHFHRNGLGRKAGGDTALLYYISPQIWAWKGHRRFKMAEMLDGLAVIFPFEVETYKDTNLAIDFVGHPFVASSHRQRVHYDPSGDILLLPGSRRAAVKRIFPVLLDGLSAFKKNHGDSRAVVVYPDEEIHEMLRSVLARYPHLETGIRRLSRDSEVNARAVLTSSGTMSLHCALAGVPGAIAYRVNYLTYWVGKAIIKIPYLGINNLLLNEPMYPEYLQGRATADNLARELEQAIGSEKRIRQTRDHALRLRQILSVSGKQNIAIWLEEKLRDAGAPAGGEAH